MMKSMWTEGNLPQEKAASILHVESSTASYHPSGQTTASAALLSAQPQPGAGRAAATGCALRDVLS